MKYDPTWSDEEKAEFMRRKYADMYLSMISFQSQDTNAEAPDDSSIRPPDGGDAASGGLD